MGPALASKSGSRGKIQLRIVHGRRASSASQRQIVEPEISAPESPQPAKLESGLSPPGYR